MMKRAAVIAAVIVGIGTLAFGQGEAAGVPAGRAKQKKPMGSPSGAVGEQAPGSGVQASGRKLLRCGALLDVQSGQMRRNVLVTVNGNRIEAVQEEGGRGVLTSPEPVVIDLQ